MRKFTTGHGVRNVKTLSSALLCLGLVWFLLSGMNANFETKRDKTTLGTSSEMSSMMKLVRRERGYGGGNYWDLELNYVSKRRVPSGADPIHNRRAAKFRQPPGA